MKISEIITEADSRRDFLKKAVGLGLGVAAPSVIPKTAQAGQYQPYSELTKDRAYFDKVWVPRFTNLRQRAGKILKKLVAAVDPRYKKKLKDIEIRIVSDQKFGVASSEEQMVGLDLTVFWDAPDEVLTVVIAHELGHIALDHRVSGLETDTAPEVERHRIAAASRKEELDADSFGLELAKKLGYNKAVVFKFIHQQIEEYKYYETLLKSPSSSHPTFQERIDNAKKMGFQLSQNGMQQMKTLVTHLS